MKKSLVEYLWNVKIVKFPNGKFGLRRGWMGIYSYLNIERLSKVLDGSFSPYWWSGEEEYLKWSTGTLGSMALLSSLSSEQAAAIKSSIKIRSTRFMKNISNLSLKTQTVHSPKVFQKMKLSFIFCKVRIFYF